MDFSWLLICALLVFCMQAGFLCLESGKIRSKNSINVAAKNISDFIFSSVIFWIFGFAIMFGDSFNGILGFSGFFVGEHQSPYQISFFLFQMMFCGTAATLLSGAVAERMTFVGYLCITGILSAAIYPVIGHWVWASAYQAGNQGWLESLGFVDFAGSTVVHSVGGYVALAAIIIIGPRLGRFDDKKDFPTGNNVPLSVLGVLLLWFGWFGFNGGSTLQLTDKVPLIILNTCLAAAWGGIVSSILHYYFKRFFDVGFILNGVIAGLVSITANCHVVTPFQAMLIGIVGGAILYFSTLWLEKLKIDDALGVVPSHLFAGIWGTIAVALFADLSELGTGLTRWEQLQAQLIGVVSIGVYCFALSYLLISLLKRFIPLRVSVESEFQGMNISEHQASTELIDLLSTMHQQKEAGAFNKPVPVEPFTEVGQIASQYNEVIERVNSEISKRDNALDDFRSSEKRKSAILESSMDSIIIINLAGEIIEFNPSAERNFGCIKQQVKGKRFIDLFIQDADREVIEASLACKFSGSEGILRNIRNSITLVRNVTETFSAEITVTSANFGGSKDNEFTLHIRDVTRQLKLQDNLRQLAYSDPLTGLYNRTYLMDSLSKAIELNQYKDGNILLFFMDLDKFKKINDTLGHKAGDDLLCEVATRLIKVTHVNDIIARWGGDEFVIFMTGNFTAEVANRKANDVLTIMRNPLQLAGRNLTIPTSVGVVMTEKGKQYKAEELIQHADIAMYHAKERGRDNYQIFKMEMIDSAQRNFNYEQEMLVGIHSGEQFHLVYQPKVTQTGELLGFEALMRWNHPKEGFISPAEFIPIAEESDLIINIGEFALVEVVQQLGEWQNKGYKNVPVSVNISGKHLVSERLVPFIEQLLSEHNFDANLLEIEITEGVLLTDIDRCIDVLSQLKALNIKISIDDFGTGYSSLNYLKRLPIDVLKIDKSFVDDCATLVEDGEICATIINLAKSLRLATVAEGVEDHTQLDFLLAHGCQVFQGYFFSKPQVAKEIELLYFNQQGA
ncbi:diguanylate cyclase [Psychromonas sp. B3M02]|uniref:ammonium transporter n=1 Tax=Psychromonas sp. B3M02 TaxID=2267226 RepID=UPI000DE8B17B|nr:ammonium transporter [Psychromonas sp. B3M02]RBW43620.1 diguanylate cyclase [Psychromonas sp. B3M02]